MSKIIQLKKKKKHHLKASNFEYYIIDLSMHYYSLFSFY